MYKPATTTATVTLTTATLTATWEFVPADREVGIHWTSWELLSIAANDGHEVEDAEFAALAAAEDTTVEELSDRLERARDAA